MEVFFDFSFVLKCNLKGSFGMARMCVILHLLVQSSSGQEGAWQSKRVSQAGPKARVLEVGGFPMLLSHVVVR